MTLNPFSIVIGSACIDIIRSKLAINPSTLDHVETSAFFPLVLKYNNRCRDYYHRQSESLIEKNKSKGMDVPRVETYLFD